MITLIICSRNSDISNELKRNIAITIGVEYELVVIDNSKNDYSIFSAYNEGAKRAQYPYLCFMHEDIIYHTQDWGLFIEKHFQDETIGLIGMAGTHFLPSIPTYWSPTPFITEYNLHNDHGKRIECYHLNFFSDKTIVDAVACDGFCMFIRKDIFNVISFDEKTYTGFHYYDMDICMQVLTNKYRVCICRDVLIEHFWSENPEKSGMDYFVFNQDLFFSKWQSYFPISRGIDEIPQYVLDRVNKLYESAYDATKARNSKAYKIGKLILSPFKFLSNIKM